MITNIKDFRSINENNEYITFWDVIDKEKFEKFALNLYNMCGGEYGYTYYNADEMKIYICLGDSNPFDDTSLKSWIENTVIKNYNHSDKIDIEIDNEGVPHDDDEADGWFYWIEKGWTESR